MEVKQVVYIAAPYRANTIHQIKRNIDYAEGIALAYWKKGYVVLCPHKNTALFDGECSDEVWLQGAIELMLRCDIVVAAGEWWNSQGCRHEIRVALRSDKHIIYHTRKEN